MPDPKLRSSFALRIFILLGLALGLLIPAFLVENIIMERQGRKAEAVAEVSGKWGGPQTITGPVLSIPFESTVKNEKGVLTSKTHHVQLLPDSLVFDGTLTPELRSRGLYDVVLYGLNLKASGNFDVTRALAEAPKNSTPQWADATLSLGISDLRGVREHITLRWNGARNEARSGMGLCKVFSTGMHFTPTMDANAARQEFEFDLALNGSSDIRFVPVGRRTDVRMRSPWPSPSFIGDFLPVKRHVSADGFTAEWSALELNRSFPQAWQGHTFAEKSVAFGVSLLVGVDEYQKTLRTAKYAALVIAFTFIAFFLSEVLAKEVLHPVHYTLVGFALLLFYMLLLSLSEHMGFDAAYGIASGAVIVLISLYARAIVAKKRIAAFVGSGLIVVYVFLYVLLQLEDYALLIGSFALLLLLGLLMFLTRKVNWYGSSGA